MKKLLIPMVALMFALPLISSAQIPVPGLLGFGGLVRSSFFCDCSGGMIIYFAPLYLSGAIPTTGGIYYSPFSTILYGLYRIGVPSRWHLGTMVPGSGCFVACGEACCPVPALGTMTKVGTN
jgi:hypothetical protein